MFNLFRRCNKKPGHGGSHEPGSDQNFKPANHTDETSRPQQPVVVLSPIVIPTDRDPPPELPFSEIIKYSREAIPNVSEDPRDMALVQTLIEMNFFFEMLTWSDGTSCTVGWAPDHKRHELTDETLLMAYVVGRTALELWHLYARGRVWGGAGGTLQ